MIFPTLCASVALIDFVKLSMDVESARLGPSRAVCARAVIGVNGSQAAGVGGGALRVCGRLASHAVFGPHRTERSCQREGERERCLYAKGGPDVTGKS